MERFVKGDVVVLPFPFSDLSAAKKRPALVVAALRGEDAILCQITSQRRDDADALFLTRKDFKEGSLPIDSWIRPTRLFTAALSLVAYKAGYLKVERMTRVIEKLCGILKRE